jgi:signal transduction histidine kinase
MMESVAKTGMAWSHYLWPKPGAKEPSEKCGYAKKATMDGQEVIVSSGLYDVKAQDCGKK